jgi:NAD(P)-dependent dehydrogenase (short-subunit alcohol dehydrogenase family)
MFKHKKIVVTGASRGFGVALVWNFARQDAKVFVTARRLQDAQATCATIRAHYAEAQVEAIECDLARPATIRSAAAAIKERADSIDVLVNNGAMWLEQGDFATTPDDVIVDVINSGTTGPILMTKHLLPLLLASKAADIVNMISKCAESGCVAPGPHEAFYAMKHGHAGFAEILAHRLKGTGIRTTSLYPPDFENTSPFDPEWSKVDDNAGKRLLNAKNLIDTINFSLSQPRNCHPGKIYFEGNRR